MTEKIEAFIIEALTTKYDVPEYDLTPGSSFESLAIDSLTLVEITVALENELGTHIPEGVVDEQQTIHEAAAAVAESIRHKVAS